MHIAVQIKFVIIITSTFIKFDFEDDRSASICWNATLTQCLRDSLRIKQFTIYITCTRDNLRHGTSLYRERSSRERVNIHRPWGIVKMSNTCYFFAANKLVVSVWIFITVYFDPRIINDTCWFINKNKFLDQVTIYITICVICCDIYRIISLSG